MDKEVFMLKIKWNYLILIGSIILMHFSAYSSEGKDEKNVDVYGNFGYTNLSGFSFNKTNKLFNNFSGFNLGVSALYLFNKNSYFTPVVGGSLNSVFTKSIDNLIGDYNVNMKFDYTTISGTGGAKFTPSNLVSIYTLANIGYAINNKISANFNSYDSYSNYASSETSFSIKKHYFYGATLMGVYNFSDIFHLGGSFVYNRHSMTLDYSTYPQLITESSSFNEYSLNIIAMWSF